MNTSTGRSNRVIRVALLACCGVIARVSDARATPPEISDPSIFVNLLRLPNGNIQRVVSNGGFLKAQTSTDHGATWGATETFISALSSSNPTPLVDNTGETHFFQFVLRDTNGTATGPNTPLVDRFLDIWQTRSSNGSTTWSPPQVVFQGYNASMMRVIQLSNGPHAGRIMLPFSNRVTNDSASPTGQFVIRATYSDDLGSTWQVSPSVLSSTVPTDWNGSSDGAAEPTVFQRNDGTLQMYARSQVGFLTESKSTDGGATWSPLKNSNFYTSTGPPNSIRLDDGRLMMFWNNATMPARYNGAIWYAGRDILHAAISADDGNTWSGYREIYLDPNRNTAGITTGDTGTAYPFPVATADGKALVITGQSTAKTQIKIDPNWLLETNRSEDFTGADPLSDWSTFKSFGAVTSVKRDRTAGAALVFDSAENKNVLSLRKPDANDPDGATWNFPMAKKGVTSLRVKLEPGFQGGSIAIGDHFYQPTDIQGEQAATFKLDISASGALSSGGTLPTGSWQDLTLQWDLAKHQTDVLLNGQIIGHLDQRTLARPGASYLRLRSSATTTDLAGIKFSSVSQVGLTTGAIHDATLQTAAETNSALTTTAGWTRFRFDNYVPNSTGQNGTVYTAGEVFTGFTQPTTGATPLDLIVSSSAGAFEFSDLTGAQITSDINGPRSGDTLTFTFVDKTNIARKAAVSSFAFRFGSTLANNVEMTLLDLDGKKIPNYTADFLTGIVTGGALGASSTSDLELAPVIHQIVFRGIGSDAWLIGSFASDPALYDFAYAGLLVTNSFTPNPWKTDASGTWSNATNWKLNSPNAIGAIAEFGDAISVPATVTLDAAQTVGEIRFDNANSYTLAGSSTLTLNGFGSASINVSAGSHTIAAPLALAKNTTFDVSPATSMLTVSNLQTTTSDIAKAGAGTLVLNRVRAGRLDIAAGSIHLLHDGTAAAASVVSALAIAPGATLDLSNNAMIVNYSGTSPLPGMLSLIADGRLFSSEETFPTTIGYGESTALDASSYAGLSLDSTALVLRLTLRGDANLDGSVDFADLLRLAQNYDGATKVWTDGDFDRDGLVSFSDLLALAQNYDLSLLGAPERSSFSNFEADWALARAIVPEPTMIYVPAFAASTVPRRRRHTN